MYQNIKGFKTFMGSHDGVDPKHIPEWQRPTTKGKVMVCLICNRCKFVIKGHNELALELAWDDHVCEGKRNLDTMDMDLLREVATGQLAEDEAWATQDLRNLIKGGKNHGKSNSSR